jgi:hypothetical protein
MTRVTETCKLEGGLTIKKLAHCKRSFCGPRFFDDDAMHRIQAERAPHGSLIQPR